ncbi:MAG: anti-sigma factor domain-containing protein [Rubrivivax sp.]|jgi:anti-sigma-K factor RskA
MNWYQHPETLRQLAGAYALGTLSGPARRRFEAVMRQHPAARQAVNEWNRRWAPVAQQLPPVPAGADLWARIEAQTLAAAPVQQALPAAAAVDLRPQTPPAAARQAPVQPAVATAAPSAATAPAPAQAPQRQRPGGAPPPTAWQRVVQAVVRGLDALLSPAPAFALAAGLLVGVLVPGQLLPGGAESVDPATATELPASYVGVLATAEGRTGLIVSSLRRGLVMDIKRVQAVPVPAGQTLYLWTLDAQGRAQPVGAFEAGAFVRSSLPRPAEDLFAQAVELGVSLEPSGSAPTAPSSAFVYRGLCGKLWRLPPPAAASQPR